MSTVIIGAIFMDVKGFSKEHYVPTGTNIGRVYMMHGGVCRNVCEDFANQGLNAAFVSMTDRSAMGRDIRERLSALGVDLRHMLYADGGMGIWLAVLDERGELVGSISQQPDFTALENHLRDHGEEIISGADCVVLEIDMNERIARTVLTIAERLGKPVYAIVGNMGVILAHPEFLRQVRCFICNEIEAGRLFSADLTAVSPEEMLALLPGRAQAAGIRSMAVTMGPAGAVFFDGETGDSGHCPALPAEMVDSTGAGDAFFAGAVMALSRGFSLRRAVQVGARLAAKTIACGESSCPKVEGLFDFPNEKRSAATRFDALTRYLDSLPGRGVPGCDLAVWQNHQLIYRHVAGERAPGVPMNGTETYWLYSCSKVFTMTAVMQLAERGWLRLSDPVADYLPAYAHLNVNDGGIIRPARTVLTIEHLMTMQGGLSYDLTMPTVRRCLEKNPFATSRELADAFAEQPLLFDPGTRFQYSLCHDVAAAVVEVVSGQSYGDYLRDHIFAPLGMRAMTFVPDTAHFARMAARYHWDTDERPIPEDNTVNPYRLSPAYESGGAGLSGDVDSCILLADALANGGVGRTGARILSEASIESMRTNRLTGASRADFDATGKAGYGYGLGVRTLTDAASSRSPLGEFGWDGAAGAWLMADPEHHLAAFYAQHVMCCGRAFDEFHPAIRDLIYEGMDG